MIVFTLCSNNYLAQAKTLGDSLAQTNPEIEFIIGLVDELNSDIDYDFLKPYHITPIANIGIKDLDSLWKKYNIIEFNTCVKASFFKYIFKQYPNINKALYIDPDIVAYNSFDLLESALEDYSIILTPHILTPIIPDGLLPEENLFLNHGLYNLGFIGINRSTTNEKGFLNWWEHRLLHYGYDDTPNGIFVDQLWLNFAPIFFDKVKILDHPGCNMAPWNLHERRLSKSEDGKYIVNEKFALIFYHFSSYRYASPEKMSRAYSRYNFENHPDVKELYARYRTRLLNNKIEYFSTISCAYINYKKNLLQQAVRPIKKSNGLKEIMKDILPPFFVRSWSKLKNS